MTAIILHPCRMQSKCINVPLLCGRPISHNTRLVRPSVRPSVCLSVIAAQATDSTTEMRLHLR